MGSVFSGYRGGAAIFRAVSPTREVGPSSAGAVASHEIRSDGPREAASLSASRSTLWQATTPSLRLHVCLLLLSRQDSSGALGVAQRLVDLSCNPQTVQKHRNLPRHGHRRPLLGVLAPAGGDLLSVTS